MEREIRFRDELSRETDTTKKAAMIQAHQEETVQIYVINN
jgi:hypothetical protein